MGAFAFNMGRGAPLTLDPAAEMQQGAEQAKQSRLAKLLGQAYNAPADQRQAVLGQAAMIDAPAAMNFEKAQGSLQNDRFSSFAQKAALASAAWKSGNQQLAQGIYASLVPEAHAIAPGFDLPAQMDDQAAQAFDQFSHMAGAGGMVQSTYVDAQGNRVGIMRDGRTQILGQNAPNNQILDTGNGFVGVNKGNLTAAPVMLGGQAPQAPSGDLMAPNGTPINIDPSLPPNIRADIAANPQKYAAGGDVQAPAMVQGQQLRSAPKPAAAPSVPSGYRFKADGSALEPIPGGPADNQAEGVDLSPDAIDNAAWDHILTGTNMAIGRGKEGIQQRTKVYNRIAEIAKQAGVSPADLATQKGKYKALQTSLANTQKQSDSVDRSTETFHRNADLMLQLSGQVPRMDSATLNKYLLNYNIQWKGDAATAAYIAAARTAVNEYAKIASGAMGGAGSSDTSRREAADAISAAQNPQQLAAVIKTLKQDAANQQNVNHAKLLDIGGRLSQFGPPPAATKVLKWNPNTGKIE